jgi:hypothetical protein
MTRDAGRGPKDSPVKSFARELARVFGGKVKRDESPGVMGTPDQHFVVKGSHRERLLAFQVFDGGCIVEGATSRKPAFPFVWNCAIERFDRRITGLPEGAMPAFHAWYLKGGEELPPPSLDALRDELRAFWENKQNRAALQSLDLKPSEPLVLLLHPMFAAGRPHFYMVHRSTNLAALARRLDALAQFLPPIPKGAEIAARVSDRAFRLKIGAKAGASPHRFGGSLDTPPCANCRTPIHVILTIDASDASLKLAKLGRRSIPILYCLNCMSWDPLYIDFSADVLRVVRQSTQEKVNEDAALEESAVSLTPLKSPDTAVSKVGGSPKWLQGPDIPDCARCAKPMMFFAQLRSLPDLSFGDEGTLYAFVCPDCKIIATFIQSH